MCGFKKLQLNRNTLYYLIASLFFILFKLWYRTAETNQLTFLLKPVDIFIRSLTGVSSTYIENNGYYYQELQVVIDKSCSGFNFGILSFLVITYLLLKYATQPKHQLLAIPMSLTTAYLLTIFVNSSRIFCSLIIENQTNLFFKSQQHIIHESIGIIINLTFLTLTYILLEKVLSKNKLNL